MMNMNPLSVVTPLYIYQIEPLDMIEYLARHAICCDLTCEKMSQSVTFNHILNYVSTQLFPFP